MQKKKGDFHHLCRSCNNIRLHPPSSADNSQPDSDPSPPPVLFDRDSSALSRLTEEQRYGIIILHKDEQQKTEIANKIPCSLKTVNHWIHHYESTHTVKETHRTGRKRKTDENTDINIVVSASVEKFIVPKTIKRALDPTVSPRTVRRHLNEAGLLGCVSQERNIH